MPLQDRPDFLAFVERRAAQEASGDEPAAECQGCGIAASERAMFGPNCIVCLAEEFGIEQTQRRFLAALRRVFGALLGDDPAVALAALQGLGDALEDAATHVTYTTGGDAP